MELCMSVFYKIDKKGGYFLMLLYNIIKICLMFSIFLYCILTLTFWGIKCVTVDKHTLSGLLMLVEFTYCLPFHFQSYYST